jgi:hypothetical protein
MIQAPSLFNRLCDEQMSVGKMVFSQKSWNHLAAVVTQLSSYQKGETETNVTEY